MHPTQHPDAPCAATCTRTSTLNPCADEWYPPGYMCNFASQSAVIASNRAEQKVNNDDGLLLLSDLPLEILSSVVSYLSSTDDIFSCIMANQQLRFAVRSARVKFVLTGRPLQLLSYPSKTGMLDDLVAGLTKYMPGMASCNLSTLPLEHRHVSKLSKGFHDLQHLDLSGCKKLQPGMTNQLLSSLSSRQLLSINLQRCFQLTDTCLTDLLEYACVSNNSSKSLQCIALSHLNLAAWPTAQQYDSSSSSSSSNNSLSSSPASSSGNESLATSGCGHHDSMNNIATPDLCLSDVSGVRYTAHHVEAPAMAQWQSAARHLLHKLPLQLASPALLQSGAVSALRVLVLNNCSLLPVTGLMSLAVACPELEYLFLGGSTLKIPAAIGSACGAQATNSVYIPRTVAAAAAAAGSGGHVTAAGDAAGVTASNADMPPALLQLSDFLQLPATLPWETLSMCCEAGSSGTAGCSRSTCSCTCGCCSIMRRRDPHENSAASEADETSQYRASKRLHRNEPSAAVVAAARCQALSLAYLAAHLPGLKAVEVTFMLPGLAGWLRMCLDKLQQLKQQGLLPAGSSCSGLARPCCVPQPQELCSNSNSVATAAGCTQANRGVGLSCARPKVWMMTCAAAVAEALEVLEAVRGAEKAAASVKRVSSSPADGSHTPCPSTAALQMAIRCAVNCSNRGRSTALHQAADAGCACHITSLLSAGAVVASRDASGASPLFVGCESGQEAAAAALLAAGADAVMGNTAGETPLYIAALRGHLSVVELLLGHLAAADVDWTQHQLYGDAWTPLMAAAVANRVSVAVCLLRTAAMHCYDGRRLSQEADDRNAHRVGPCPSITRLLAAENRYGQTVLHIAARKGCKELLQLLLLYGAGHVAGRVADAAGDTPVDIARRFGHELAVKQLLQQC